MKKDNSKYSVKNGLICFKENPEAFERIVIPECLRAWILRMHHNIELAGHQGHKRVIDQITQFCFWPGMTQDAVRWVRGCVACKKRKTPRPLRQGMTQPVFSRFPNHTVAIDIVGPMLETSSGNLWILTMIDVFTRWPLAVAIPNRKSSVIGKIIFERWICEKGVPAMILSDQGRELVSLGIQSMCKRIGIRKVQTAGYNPTGNACIERFHRFLTSSLAILYNRTGTDWDDFLPPVLFAYRASQHDTTGFSPFYLETGRFPTLPVGTLVGEYKETGAENGVEWADKVVKRLRTAFAYVREAQEEVAKKNKERKATQLFAPRFQEGDVLFLWENTRAETRLRGDIKEVVGHAGGLPTKLTNRWGGPYQFARMVGERHAVIIKNGKEVRHNVNRLWKHQPWDEWHPDTGILPVGEESQKNRKEILAEKEKKNESGKEKRELQEGEVVVFVKDMTDNDLRFGVGRI